MERSEFREDAVSGDWILVAPSRQKRSRNFFKKQPQRKRGSRKNCPFDDPQKTGQSEPYFIYKKNNTWEVQVFQNKYPAVRHSATCATLVKHGPSKITEGIGCQDLVVTRDHDKNFPKLSSQNAFLVLQAFQERYRMLALDSCIKYVSIFHNWGFKAGASVYHPHYQIIGLPIIPPDVWHSLRGSLSYQKKHRVCVHCAVLSWEKKEKKRVVYENKGVLVVAPFVSRVPFELRLIPKKHMSFFEDASRVDLRFVSDALQKSLRALQEKVHDPDYNFFIHTAPIPNKKKYAHYHWHIEILPKISTTAGFELGTGIDINVFDPDEAAKILRKRY